MVIQGSDESIAVRYLARADVERWQDIKDYQEDHVALGRQPFTGVEIEKARDAAKTVASKYGREMSSDNGWAKPLFPDLKARERVSFLDLEGLASLNHLRPFYRLASHHVHAGARAAELNRYQGMDGRILIPTGATLRDNLAELGHGALISLLQVTAALVVEAQKDDMPREIEATIGLQCLRRLVDDAGTKFSSAAKTARERGWVVDR